MVSRKLFSYPMSREHKGEKCSNGPSLLIPLKLFLDLGITNHQTILIVCDIYHDFYVPVYTFILGKQNGEKN